MTFLPPARPHEGQPLRIVLPLPERPLLELTLLEGDEPRYRQREADGTERTITQGQFDQLLALSGAAQVAGVAYDKACQALRMFLRDKEVP